MSDLEVTPTLLEEIKSSQTVTTNDGGTTKQSSQGRVTGNPSTHDEIRVVSHDEFIRPASTTANRLPATPPFVVREESTGPRFFPRDSDKLATIGAPKSKRRSLEKVIVQGNSSSSRINLEASTSRLKQISGGPDQILLTSLNATSITDPGLQQPRTANTNRIEYINTLTSSSRIAGHTMPFTAPGTVHVAFYEVPLLILATPSAAVNAASAAPQTAFLRRLRRDVLHSMEHALPTPLHIRGLLDFRHLMCTRFRT